jgi:predicted Zn-dependent protease
LATPDPGNGQLSPALVEAHQVLQVDPERAEVLARTILQADPADPGARLLLGTALRMRRRPDEAYPVLIALVEQFPEWAAVLYQLGLTLCQQGSEREGLAFLLSAERLVPGLPGLARALGDARFTIGELAAADAAYCDYLRTPAFEPSLMQAQDALAQHDWRDAEALLRPHLARQPEDPLALLMLAEVALGASRHASALELFARVLARAPSWQPARCSLALVHAGLGDYQAALGALDVALAANPGNTHALEVRATTLRYMGDLPGAIEVLLRLRTLHPDEWHLALMLAEALQSASRSEEAIREFRRTIRLRRSCGAAWLQLAVLGHFTTAPEDVARLEHTLADPATSGLDRAQLQLARARVHHDAGEHAAAFRLYSAGNRLWRGPMPPQADSFAAYTQRCRAQLSPQFFAARAGSGAAAVDPIFVVGMPCSGSAHVARILAAHPAVEAGGELPELMSIADRLGGDGHGFVTDRYPGVLATLDDGALRALGAEYLERARAYRRGGRPRFVDAMPNNFLHIALIQLALPDARIIDVRRHPLACCWSAFRQHFQRGQAFSFDLAEMGAWYRQYVAQLAHFDAILPGRVLHVDYEQLLAAPDANVRGLLAHCGLDQQPGCLQVASAPHGREVTDWQPYERWLGPLKAALGDVVAAYPALPAG